MIELLLEPVKVQDKSILRNMLELCSHDYSEFNNQELDEHGFFGYEYLDNYWTEPGRYAFFIRVAGKLAGFAMVRQIVEQGDEPVFSMAEFFILRKHRRAGIGKAAAHSIFDLFPGRWSVEQEPGNIPAQHFWLKTIGEYTNGDYKETFRDVEGELRPAQLFISRSKPRE